MELVRIATLEEIEQFSGRIPFLLERILKEHGYDTSQHHRSHYLLHWLRGDVFRTSIIWDNGSLGDGARSDNPDLPRYDLGQMIERYLDKSKPLYFIPPHAAVTCLGLLEKVTKAFEQKGYKVEPFPRKT